MIGALTNDEKGSAAHMLGIAMTDYVGPNSDELSQAVFTAFQDSREPYLNQQATAQSSAQNSMALASNLRKNF